LARPVRGTRNVPRKSWAEDIVFTDDITSHKFKTLLKGQAGVGKTEVIASYPRPFVIDWESGLLTLGKHHIPNYPIGAKAQGRYYDTMMAILDAIENNESIGKINFAEIDSIGIDSLSKMNELLLRDIMNVSGNVKAELDDWGTLDYQISGIMNRFIQLDKYKVATIGEAEKVDTKTQVSTWSVNMRGNYRKFVEHEFDFVIWMKKEESRTGETFVATGKNMGGRTSKLRLVELPPKMDRVTFDLIEDAVKVVLGAEVIEEVEEKSILELDLNE